MKNGQVTNIKQTGKVDHSILVDRIKVGTPFRYSGRLFIRLESALDSRKTEFINVLVFKENERPSMSIIGKAAKVTPVDISIEWSDV